MVDRRARNSIHRLGHFAVMMAALVFGGSAQAAQSLFWLQTNDAASELGTAMNPEVIINAGQSVPLYLWLDKDSVAYGFDGISLDVRLISSNGGTATASIAFDEPVGRWHGTSGGTTRIDSGGTGVDDCNAIDLSNTDTLSPDPLRLATLNITGVTNGTVQVFLCIGAFGMADGGSNAVVWIGLADNSTAPETQLINGGVSGLCSNTAEATITITSPYTADFDDDSDVDQTDFAHMQLCLSGSVVPQTDPLCADTLLNDDPFVDESDVSLFLSCLSGPNITPPVHCQ